MKNILILLLIFLSIIVLVIFIIWYNETVLSPTPEKPTEFENNDTK